MLNYKPILIQCESLDAESLINGPIECIGLKSYLDYFMIDRESQDWTPLNHNSLNASPLVKASSIAAYQFTEMTTKDFEKDKINRRLKEAETTTKS